MGACPTPTFALGEAKLCLLIQIKEIHANEHMEKLENRFSLRESFRNNYCKQK